MNSFSLLLFLLAASSSHKRELSRQSLIVLTFLASERYNNNIFWIRTKICSLKQKYTFKTVASLAKS